MNIIIQDLVKVKNWQGLYDYLISNDVTLEDINANYDYKTDTIISLVSGEGVNFTFCGSSASLLTIAVQHEQVEIVELLLRKGCALSPEEGLQPLEVLFENLISNRYAYWSYYYKNLSNIRLTLIEKLLTYAVEKNIDVNVSVPFGDKSKQKELAIHKGQPSLEQMNSKNSSYLQLICAGNSYPQEVDKKVFRVIELLLKKGADIKHKDRNKKTIVDYIYEPEILVYLIKNKFLDRDFITHHAKIYRAKLTMTGNIIHATSEILGAQTYSDSQSEYREYSLRVKADILCEYMENNYAQKITQERESRGQTCILM